MSRHVEKSSNLEKYLAMSSRSMNNNQIGTILDCCMGKAITARKNLEVKALEMKLFLLPNAEIQTSVFEKFYGIYQSDFENDPAVISFKTERGMRV